MTAQAGGEEFDFRSGEAVQEEVRGDQVVPVMRRLKRACVCEVGVHAAVIGRCTRCELREHGFTCVDGIDEDVGIRSKKAGCETAVSIPENEPAAALLEAGARIIEICASCHGLYRPEPSS